MLATSVAVSVVALVALAIWLGAETDDERKAMGRLRMAPGATTSTTVRRTRGVTTLRARAVRIPDDPEVWATCRGCGGEIQLLGTDWHHPDEAKHAAEPDHSCLSLLLLPRENQRA